MAELRVAPPRVFVINPTVYWKALAIERFPELLRWLEAEYVPIEPSSRHGSWRIYQRKAVG